MPSQPQQRAPAPPTLRRDLDVIRANLRALTPVAGPNQFIYSTSDGFSIIENPKSNPHVGGGGEVRFSVGLSGDGFAFCAQNMANVSAGFKEYNEGYSPNGSGASGKKTKYLSSSFPAIEKVSVPFFGPVLSEAFVTLTAPSPSHWLTLFGLYVPRWGRWRFTNPFASGAFYEQYGYSFHAMQCPKVKVDANGLPVWLSSQPAAQEVQFIMFADEWGQPEGKPKITWI